VHRTPTFAIAVQQSIGIVAILIVGLALTPGDIFGFLGTVTTLSVIVLYVMANFALTAYIRALGIALKPEVLPLSNLAGYLPPFWLSPQLAMRRK
jgi:amino acid transporter